MVTSRAVVGSSAMRSFGSRASAIAIITRWRWPPESLVRVGVADLGRIGQADLVEQRQRPPPALAGLEASVGAKALGDLVGDPHHRVERGHRLLEHHPDLAAADVAHGRLRQPEELPAGEADRPASR